MEREAEREAEREMGRRKDEESTAERGLHTLFPPLPNASSMIVLKTSCLPSPLSCA